jgi:predicted NBD/HSP70 family sugar kinase
VLTVGSGVGHKVFVNGEPLLGPFGRGGEIGHLRVDADPDAPPCDCGGRGHLGGIASGRGSVRLVRGRAEQDGVGFRRSILGKAVPVPSAIDGPAVANAFGRGDPWVRAVIRAGVGYLGQGMAAIHLATGVERFAVVGGFAFAMGEPYRQMVVRAVEAACWQIGQDWDSAIRFGVPDDDQGMIGAGLIALREGLESGRS